MKHEIELVIGYTDKTGVTHKKIEFGYRPTVGDLMKLDTDPQAQNPTQYTDLLNRRMMTKFGELKELPPLGVLLGLDSIDREDIEEGASQFLINSRNEKDVAMPESDLVVLRFGFVVDGTNYNKIKFGNRITGNDEVEADRLGLSGGATRAAFIVGKQISEISTEDGSTKIEGQVGLEFFKTLDAEDFNFLRMSATLWTQSFRFKREKFSENDSKRDIPADEGNGNERSGSTKSANGTA